MKTKEEILADQGITEETLAGDYAEVCLAMQLYSDQQNKELMEELGAANSAIYSLQENLTYAVKTKELENDGWKVMAKAQDAEIQRLTKEVNALQAEVEELKSRIENLKWVRENDTRPAELTRLRELLRKVQLEAIGYNESTLSSELLTEIDNALNHKP